jgi:hypothetical protein
VTQRLNTTLTIQDYHQQLRDRLMKEHGPMMTGLHLAKALGFSSATALRRAALAESAGVRTFPIAGRRGRFAFTDDVAAWLIGLRAEVMPERTEEG